MDENTNTIKRIHQWSIFVFICLLLMWYSSDTDRIDKQTKKRKVKTHNKKRRSPVNRDSSIEVGLYILYIHVSSAECRNNTTNNTPNIWALS